MESFEEVGRGLFGGLYIYLLGFNEASVYPALESRKYALNQASQADLPSRRLQLTDATSSEPCMWICHPRNEPFERS